MIRLCNIELDKLSWIALIIELYNFQHIKTKSIFQFERYCKCTDMDVKVILRTNVEFIFDDNQNLDLSIKSSVSTDCISLRRNNFYWNDKESIYSNCRINKDDVLENCLEECVEDLIKKISYFRICTICRLLYQDTRIDNENSICIHCYYDSIFSIKDSKCVICTENIQEREFSFTLTCGHTFHSGCILMNFIKNSKRECPLCREVDTHQL